MARKAKPKERSRRGTGTVYASEGGWVARYPLGVVDGKRISKRARAATEALALVELEKLRRIYGGGGTPGNMTLDAYLDDWMTAHGPSVRPSTRRSYAGHIKTHIKPLLGGIILSKLQRRDVRRLVLHSTEAGAAPATVIRIISTLKVALNAAVGDGSILSNPAAGIRLPRVDREPVRALTEADAIRVMEVVAGQPHEALFTLLLGSGMRLGEAIGLDWRDVHLDAAYVSVRVSKSRIRAVPISDDAVDALRVHKKNTAREGEDEPVFLGLRGKAKLERLTPSGASHALPRLLKAAGLRTMRVHDLRHGAATLMLSRGTPMRVISEQLGHANPSMTAKVYAHVIPETQRMAVSTLNLRKRATGSQNGSQEP